MLTALLLLACGPNLWAAPVDDDAAADDFFTQKIEPILQQRCLGCHSHAAGEMEGELALDSASGWQVGGSRGTAIVPGNPDASLFLQAVRRSDPDFSMPPDDRLSAGEIQLLTEWIERGAADPQPWPTFPQKTRATGGRCDRWCSHKSQRWMNTARIRWMRSSTNACKPLVFPPHPAPIDAR